MRLITLLAGLFVAVNAFGAVVGLRPSTLNGQPVTDDGGGFFMDLGDAAIIELYVEGVEYRDGDPLTGLASFDIRILYDPTFIALSNPNTYLGSDIGGAQFLPLGGKSPSDIACVLLSGRCTSDPEDFLTSTGRERGTPLIIVGDGSLRIGVGTSPGSATETPVGDGVLALIAVEFLAAGDVGAAAAQMTALTLIGGSPTNEGKLLIEPDGFTIPTTTSSLVVNPVPLPGAALAMLSALGVLALRGFKRRSVG